MKPPFYVTGLPRSMTTWLANLLTTDTTICFHEPTKSITQLIDENPDYRVGISSSMLCAQARLLLSAYPDAPWLFVDRNRDDAKRSLMKFSDGRLFGKDIDHLFNLHETHSKSIKESARCLVVPFHELEHRIVEVWLHLLPEVEINPKRVEMLKEFKIEQRLERALNRIAAEHVWQH